MQSSVVKPKKGRKPKQANQVQKVAPSIRSGQTRKAQQTN